MNVYHLWADTAEFSSLQQVTSEESISMLALRQRWRPFPRPLPQVTLELYRSDKNKKNYDMDVSTVNAPFMVFSQSLAEAFEDILAPRGQFIPVRSPSKRKGYVGYYPTNPVANCLDLERSDYAQYEHGKVVRRYVLTKSQITDDWLFPVADGGSVFVTDKFREAVERKGFHGFSWRREVKLS